MIYHLAIDIGASSGRHMLGFLEDGKLRLEKVYRFENGIKRTNDGIVWDIEALVKEVKAGIKKCGEIGKIPATIAIDTWGVDYVLLDENKAEIMPVHSYRDTRTEAVVDKVESIVSAEELYSRTGIQKQSFNTVYQLMCDKLSGKLEKAAHFLMLPEYLSFKLTGVIANEYTNATTTGMVNADTKAWDEEIISRLGYKKELFGSLSLPTAKIGNFTEEMREYAGFDSTVIFCPSHDTASAVAACPVKDDAAYISSGTWSLFGVEMKEPILSDASRKANFTNEGGIEYRFRFLKNYMGMWLLQSIRKNLDEKFSYDELMEMAINSEVVEYFDVNDPRISAPENMIEAVRACLGKPDMPIGDVINCVYHSLAKGYKNAADEIETITNKQLNAIHIVGGGCKNTYLNHLTEHYTGKTVSAGPSEATATGNLISQLIYSGECADIDSAREIIKNTF